MSTRMDIREIARQPATLRAGETVLLPRRDLSEAVWKNTDELERELRSVLGGEDWVFRWTEDGLWVTRREP